ncbi:MAG: aminotransferase class I/II-fold pyridoxal phosphate-dependent enzyme [Ignavibacteriaceae bacterium]|nr:aminotransferase class I/II-fold pyridoxal phosphate-dependent enzyme [Ignavibacteriaceae bacterium]
MQNLLNSKLPCVSESIFAVMTRMANEFNAINLSQGFPDFNCSVELLDRVGYYQKKGFNQYAPMPGVKELRENISKKIEKLHGKRYDPDQEIVITAGATQALYTAITTIINPGDEAIIFEPAYDSYSPAVTLNGGVPIYLPLTKGNYKIDWDLVGRTLTNRTKLIIINSPHNPSGSILDKHDLTILANITHNKDIFVISDEVYEHIIFDEKIHYSIAGIPELSKRAFVVSSFGKTYHTTGWKLGYCAGPESLMHEFKKIHQFIVFAVNTPIQYAYADIITNENMYLSLSKFYQSKRDLIISLLANSQFSLIPSSGTYFQLLDYSNISNLNDLKFSEYLTKQKGVAVIPLSPFYSKGIQEKIIRICFAKRDDVLNNAAQRLNQLKAI